MLAPGGTAAACYIIRVICVIAGAGLAGGTFDVMTSRALVCEGVCVCGPTSFKMAILLILVQGFFVLYHRFCFIFRFIRLPPSAADI